MKEHCDFLIVGSGAVGAVLAARLAEYGFDVVVLEAGGDPVGENPESRAIYQVPAFHPLASEHAAFDWAFGVKHYEDLLQAVRDPKLMANGLIDYPRASMLGGCTGHHAMITVKPGCEFWDYMVKLTGDESWSSENMEGYWRRLENCHHRGLITKPLGLIGINPSGHGWRGWLHTEQPLPLSALGDWQLLKTLGTVGYQSIIKGGQLWRDLRNLLVSAGDPNDIRVSGEDGLCRIPLSTKNHKRHGPRERLLDVAGRMPKSLDIRLNALLTRAFFDDNKRAKGVEYLEGERLYRACRNPSNEPGKLRRVYARHGVVFSCGAFNSPQALMLSGIGDRAALESLGIETLVDLPGVGRNGQDRLEVVGMYRMSVPWRVLAGGRFKVGDPLFEKWLRSAGGYITNGSPIALRRGDLFLFPVLIRFKGYYPGYTKEMEPGGGYFSWLVLKAHPRNKSGTVTLRTPDPRDVPDVSLRFFHEGGEGWEHDRAECVSGLEEVRRLMRPLVEQGLAVEVLPGLGVQGAALGQYSVNTAWSHHFGCTCPIGARESGGVLSSDFAVHGTENFYVIDLSSLPILPGFFPAAALYIIAEKAADVLRDKARKR